MTLDNGTVLELIDARECCAWYNAVIGNNIKLKTIITDVDEEPDYDSDEADAYRIIILGEDSQIGTIDVTGDPTSGYYCHSAYFSVRVNKAKPEFVDDVVQHEDHVRVGFQHARRTSQVPIAFHNKRCQRLSFTAQPDCQAS